MPESVDHIDAVRSDALGDLTGAEKVAATSSWFFRWMCSPSFNPQAFAACVLIQTSFSGPVSRSSLLFVVRPNVCVGARPNRRR